MNILKKNLILISDKLLLALLEYKKKHPEFTFSLRTKDSVQSEEDRLTVGQWFQGSNYIFVPLFKKGDRSRKVKTIGFVLTFNEDGSIQDNYIEISFKGGIETESEIEFHKKLALELGIELNETNVGYKGYDDPNKYIENLSDYLNNLLPIAKKLLEEFKISDQYIITEDRFQRDLQKTMEIRSSLYSPAENSTPVNSKNRLNTILFGPPGTGKTYNTISSAVAIANPDFKYNKREELKTEYERLVNEGQIAFTTFHQSMSYEDFIEGIKPLSPKQSNSLQYDIQPGIFKRICEIASRSAMGVEVYDQEKYYSDFIREMITDKLDNGEKVVFKSKTNTDVLILDIDEYDRILVSPKKENLDYTKKYYVTKEKILQLDAQYKDVSEIKNVFEDIRSVVKGVSHSYYWAVLSEFKKYQNSFYKSKIDTSKIKNYVLIIDEINRGNVSQIFGELITLIEEDKREGKPEVLEVTLPYSKEKFSVPPNLYIIGTMNTADRSVEALDAALRRRFSFVEMPPKYELDELTYPYANFTANDILKRINIRLEKLLDKDHAIGHSYFIRKANESEVEKLISAFYNNIIPLLQEYFFGDYGKIGLVLGKGFVRKKQWTGVDGFAPFEYDSSGDFDERDVYEIIDYRKGNNVEDENFERAIKLLMQNSNEKSK